MSRRFGHVLSFENLYLFHHFIFREKSMSLGGGDSKIIEEKLDAVSDLKTQIRALINDNEDVKMNQEELNANMAGVNKQVITKDTKHSPL